MGLMEWEIWRYSRGKKRRAGRALQCSSAKVVAHWIRCKFECSMWLDEGPRKRLLTMQVSLARLPIAATRYSSCDYCLRKMFLACSTQVEPMFDVVKTPCEVQRGTLVSAVCPDSGNRQFVLVGARLCVDSRRKMSAANITGLTMVGVLVIFAARSGGWLGATLLGRRGGIGSW